MKKLIILTVVIAALIGCNSRTNFNEKVDEKFGFKDLKLESSLSEVQSKINGLLQYPDNPNIYLITDSTYYTLGDSKLVGITVEFFDNKLISIYCLGCAHSMLEALSALYGELDDTQILLTDNHMWVGKNASVIFDRNTPTVYYRHLNINPFTEKLDDYTKKLVMGQSIAWDYILQKKGKTYGAMKISSRKLKDQWLEQSGNESKARAGKAGADL